MSKKENLYKKLDEYKNFDRDNNHEKFLDTVDQIVLSGDPSCIPELLKYFNDESEYSWVFESLSGAIEHFNVTDYVKELLKGLSILFPKGKEWAVSLVSRIFNDKDYLETFRNNMNLADKASLLKLFDIMEKESPHHKDLIAELRKELDKSGP